MLPFMDVSRWQGNINWDKVKASGLVSGVGGGKFDPNATMTQEEFITVLDRHEEFENLDARENMDKNPLSIMQPQPKYKSFSH